MNFFKSTLLVCALACTSAAFAQTPDQTAPSTAPQAATAPHREPNPGKEAKRLSKELGLSGDQVAQLRPILADREQRIQTLDSNSSLDPKSRRQQRRAIMLDTEQKLNAVLTPAQQQQFATLKSERRQHGSSQSPAGAPPTVQ